MNIYTENESNCKRKDKFLYLSLSLVVRSKAGKEEERKRRRKVIIVKEVEFLERDRAAEGAAKREERSVSQGIIFLIYRKLSFLCLPWTTLFFYLHLKTHGDSLFFFFVFFFFFFFFFFFLFFFFFFFVFFVSFILSHRLFWCIEETRIRLIHSHWAAALVRNKKRKTGIPLGLDNVNQPSCELVYLFLCLVVSRIIPFEITLCSLSLSLVCV